MPNGPNHARFVVGSAAALDYTRVPMASRLSVILLVLAALAAQVVGLAASGVGADGTSMGLVAAASSGSGCCGDECRCDERCPCVQRDEREAPSRGTPSAPAAPRDQRMVLLSLPSLVATLLAELPQAGVVAMPAASDAGRPTSGRCILALVSRWTT